MRDLIVLSDEDLEVLNYLSERGELFMTVLGTTAAKGQWAEPALDKLLAQMAQKEQNQPHTGPKAQAQQGPLDFSGLAKIPVKFAGAEVLMTVEQFTETLESMMATAFGHGIRFKESSCIKDMKYIVSERALVVTFPGSGTYRYENVTPADIAFLSDAESESVGRRFNEWRHRANPKATKLS
jgi:hypothetical protein